jgi:hypothetical protein
MKLTIHPVKNDGNQLQHRRPQLQMSLKKVSIRLGRVFCFCYAFALLITASWKGGKENKRNNDAPS